MDRLKVRMTFDERVSEVEIYLNDTEDDIVEYIRKHRRILHKMSIQKIAEELFIAPNWIMRLSKKLGYSGFAELKFAVQNELIPQNKTLSRQLMELLPGNIVRTLDIIDDVQIERVASIMRKARMGAVLSSGRSVAYCQWGVGK